MNHLTANQIILLFQLYTGEDFVKSHTFTSDFDVLLEMGLVLFDYGMISFLITDYGKLYCTQIISQTRKP